MTATSPTSLRQISFRLRKAEADDSPAIASLIDRAEDLRQVSPRESFPLEAQTVEHWLRERDAGYVLLQQNEIVAYAELVPDAGKKHLYWIGHMMVQPSRRGLGLGRRTVVALLRVAIEQLEAIEVAISAFDDNPRALSCYLGCGFRERSRQRINGRELVEMRFAVPGHRRLLSRSAIAALTPAAVGVSAALLPWGARSWLTDQSALVTAAFLLGIAAATTGIAVLLQPLLPRRRASQSSRLAMPLVFATSLGVLASVVALLVAVVLGTEGTGADTWMQTIASGLRHGAAWGVVLLLGAELLPRILRRSTRGS